jgi:DNA repair exonuclease SbcCD ATPase subunit
MDKSERLKFKTLANDAIIATFGHDTDFSRVAEALERCVDEIEDANDKCPTCSTCENHGDHEDESLAVDADEVMDAHKKLKERLTDLRVFQLRLTGYVDEFGFARIDEDLAELLEALESDIDSVEACVVR